jgi:Arc/MetJ-type ribon-helix-helix transcriptional regulator
VAQAISIRLDDEAQRALTLLMAPGVSRSDAIRQALIETAQARLRRRAIAHEMAQLEADEADRAEMAEVAALMEELRGPR